MTTRIDRRFLDRRRHVREDGARRRLRWGIALVAAAAVAAVLMLAFRSPLLAVRDVRLSGVGVADVSSVLDSHDVRVGVPTIAVRASRLEDAIESDPWVERASVRVRWPGSVEVAVIERTPAAWVGVSGGWVLVATDGTVLETGSPPAGAPRVRLDIGTPIPGDHLDVAAALAGVEFITALPAPLASGAIVRGGDGGLRAVVKGHKVSLGTPVDMTPKAGALAALFEAGLPSGAKVNLIAPSFPAVSYPQPEVEGSKEASSGT